MTKKVITRIGPHGKEQKLIQDLYRCPKCGHVRGSKDITANEGRWVDV